MGARGATTSGRPSNRWPMPFLADADRDTLGSARIVAPGSGRRVRADFRLRRPGAAPSDVGVTSAAETGTGAGAAKSCCQQPSATEAKAESGMDDADVDAWVNSELHSFIRSGDEARFRHVLRTEVAHRRASGDGVMRSYEVGAAGETLVIAFGGLQQHIGGGHGGGVAPYEFVRSCRRAGATHALFLRDATRSWYLRGVGGSRRQTGGDACGDGLDDANAPIEDCSTFDEMIGVLRAEVARIAPARVVTVGSSMGGYAAVRAGLALNAQLAVAFSPQVLLEPAARKAANLDPMHFDELLSWLQVVGQAEHFSLLSLTDAARGASPGCTTHVQLHVGASEAGDVHEAELLLAAIDETRASMRNGAGPTASLRVHPNRDHNLVVRLRDSGELHDMLQGWLQPDPRSVCTGKVASAPLGVAALEARWKASPTDASAAYVLASAWLKAHEPTRALEVIDCAIRLRPAWVEAWVSRCEVLRALKRYIDAALTIKHVLPQLGALTSATAERANAVMRATQASQTELSKQLPELASRADGGDAADQRVAYEGMAALDPTSVYARAEEAGARVTDALSLQQKASQRVRGGVSNSASRLALEAHRMLHGLLVDLDAYESHATRPAAPPSAEALRLAGSGGGARSADVTAARDALDRWLAECRTNCPLPPPPLMRAFRAKVEMNLGFACNVLHESGASVEYSLSHFERSAELDPSPSWQTFSLWHDAIGAHPDYCGEEHAEKRRAAQLCANLQAVRAGVWEHPSQRPSHFLRGLLAKPWHDARDFAPCRVLLAAYEQIRAEALQLLRVDASEARHTSTSVFCSYLSSALAAGDWADVGLYYNGMRNDKNARRAPVTSSLLGSDESLRRDATSCPFGSAYFSLLRPGTRLSAHCGPTNARLRAHLALVVPDGDICIRCGDEPPRRWVEGEVLLFDDSFEHEVWNLTEQPRLVLIVDLWHPQLDSDEKRMSAMQTDDERQVYRGVASRREYRSTELRGH